MLKKDQEVFEKIKEKITVLFINKIEKNKKSDNHNKK